MLNFVWLGLIIGSVLFGMFDGTLPQVVNSVTQSAKFAFELALGLGGIMTLWLGLMRVAEDAGLIALLGRLLRPIMTRLFRDVPAEHPAMGAMILNIAANMLGLSNAATPFGLRAMRELESLNPHPGVATNAMCTFLAINTSSIQLIPTTAIAYLAAGGATDPTQIIITALLATLCSTIVAVIAVKWFEKWRRFRIQPIQPTSNPNPSTTESSAAP